MEGSQVATLLREAIDELRAIRLTLERRTASGGRDV